MMALTKEQQEIKAIRVETDALMQRIQKYEAEYGKSRALSLMFTHAELTKMYGGKRLEEINASSYPAELADRAEVK